MQHAPGTDGYGVADLAAARHTLRCRTVAGGGSHALNYVRDLPAMEVTERLGQAAGDAAMTPSEAVLAALGSCLAASIRAGAVTGSIAVRSLSLDIQADTDKSPLWGAHGAPFPGFEAIRVVVDLSADAPADALRALVASALLWSPVANTLHNSVHLDMTLAEAGPT